MPAATGVALRQTSVSGGCPAARKSAGTGRPMLSFGGNRLIVPAVRRGVAARCPRRGAGIVTAALPGVDGATVHAGLEHAAVGVQNLMYTIADADVAEATASVAQKSGPINTLASGLESILKFYQDKLDAQHVPYSYGWSIVALVATVKLATFPLVKSQVESSMAVQNLKPRLDAIKARYGDDEERVKKETSLLYEKAQVNPLAGCLPTLATIPIFLGLFRSLSNAAAEGIFDNEGFYWIPSLAGPTTVAARQAGNSTAWLFPFVDGHPPLGWDEASHYLVLPALLVLTQFWSASVLKPPVDPESEQAKTTAQIVKFLPLMVGWFSLNVPSGLSLYYFSNTVLTAAQQIFLRKLGGAEVDEVDLGPIKNVGSARRNGEAVSDDEVAAFLDRPVMLAAALDGGMTMPVSAASSENGAAAGGGLDDSEPVVELLQRRSKRKRKGPPPGSELTANKEVTVTVTAAEEADPLANEFPMGF